MNSTLEEFTLQSRSISSVEETDRAGTGPPVPTLGTWYNHMLVLLLVWLQD